jgi:hypothetical protein
LRRWRAATGSRVWVEVADGEIWGRGWRWTGESFGELWWALELSGKIQKTRR